MGAPNPTGHRQMFELARGGFQPGRRPLFVAWRRAAYVHQRLVEVRDLKN
jgi:hypothetical protein